MGSVARYGIGKIIPIWYAGKFPLGTLLANTLACLIVGLSYYFFKEKIASSDNLKYLVIIGFCGGFSTFSAFSLETIKLLQEGNTALALTNIVLNISIGFSLIYFLYK